MTDPKQGWKTLAFRDIEDVPLASAEARTAHIRERAMEKFGLAESDINAEKTPAYAGIIQLRNIENGGIDTLHAFDLQISSAAAARLSAVHHPDILLIADVVEPQPHAFGALPPPVRKMPKGPKIRW